jgi:hypothetical protein
MKQPDKYIGNLGRQDHDDTFAANAEAPPLVIVDEWHNLEASIRRRAFWRAVLTGAVIIATMAALFIHFRKDKKHEHHNGCKLKQKPTPARRSC